MVPKKTAIDVKRTGKTSDEFVGRGRLELKDL